ncbi:MAG TPA: D-2-hydroxyacid dehydrogenase [Patescibacteria group bacterium]|nr:D-2-hydroxyacid dehydrogenase [Patescibacteria group bacterium]
MPAATRARRRPTVTRRSRERRRGPETSASPTVLIWLDTADDYVRAAETAGLARSFDLVVTPLASDPPDDLLARADALLAWRPPDRLAARAPRLRWIQSLTGGCEQWLGPDVPAGAVLTCARGTHRVQMSEHILAGLFLCAKDLAGIVLDQAAGRWRRRVNPTLAGTTLGILGLGAIGPEIARLARGLGMRVIGTKREPTPIPDVEQVHAPGATDHVLAESDYVLLLLPSTADTRGIMDTTRLARMKPSAWLLNFGRGDLVVDADLVAAVRERRIAGAVLDVFRREPLPAEHPFWTTPGIVVLPHVGGLHPRRDAIVAGLWVDNLERFAAGEPLREVVDRARGY